MVLCSVGYIKRTQLKTEYKFRLQSWCAEKRRPEEIWTNCDDLGIGDKSKAREMRFFKRFLRIDLDLKVEAVIQSNIFCTQLFILQLKA